MIHSTIVSDVTPSSSVEVHRFQETYLLHPQDRRVSQRGTVEKAGDMKNVFGLIFDPEDGSSTYLRNVGGLLPNYSAL
jgi:hypothetical protein